MTGLPDWLRYQGVRGGPGPAVAPRWALYAGVMVGVWISVALYGDSLSLPFIQEDSFHIRWLEGRSIADIWLSAQGAPDYRPLGKSLVKLWYLVLGSHDRAWLRFQNIGLHCLNVALTGAIASRLDTSNRRAWTGGIAGLLFALLPFTYQAVPWINNFFYPLSMFLLLGMTLAYWQGRVRNSRSLVALALFLCLLAPFEIEYGAVGSGLLLVVELALWLQGRVKRPWLLVPALGLLMNVAFVIRWLTVPKESYSFGPPTAERVVQISTYFLQGLAFPVSPLANRVREMTGASDLLAIAIVCVPWLALLIVFMIRQQQLALLVAGLLWFGLLALPSLVAVDFDYVINSPRLIYPPGPAVAWLWAGPAASLMGAQTQRVFGRALGALVLLAAGVAGVPFVRERMDVYHLVQRPVDQLAEVALEQPDEEPLLVVNMPSWVTPADGVFALGNHGIQLIPEYVRLGDLVFAMTATEQVVRPVQFTLVRQQQPYYYGMLGDRLDYDGLEAALAGSGDVYLTHYGPSEINLEWAGRVTAVDAVKPVAYFGDALELAVFDHGTRPGEVSLTLIWTLHRAIDQDWTVFAHLYDSSGALVSQSDGYPLRGLAPFWMWDGGRRLMDPRTLPAGTDAGAGPFEVGVGVYDRATGERVSARGASGVRLANETALLLRVEMP